MIRDPIEFAGKTKEDELMDELNWMVERHERLIDRVNTLLDWLSKIADPNDRALSPEEMAKRAIDEAKTDSELCGWFPGEQQQ